MQILLIFTAVTVFTLMLSIGINQPVRKLLAFWKQPDVLIPALISVIVLVPATAVLLLRVFNLPPEVATGLAILAAAPGAPMTTKRSQAAAADIDYVSSLQLTLALLAVIVTPVTLAIFYGLFDLTIDRFERRDLAAEHPDVVKQMAAAWQTWADRVGALRHGQP